ncbi:HD domain-containing protein [Solirubrobacter ginsenosidimutans]|uniref:HD domain-containing protein n=1 Tax=Solirubrobacter ginsenosidimutans TaxID=490573 RepID=A0A9X3MSJ8_9ACTN|nr:HD domain-containing phosphohydrolase [Solirubrobacter ginsenosidimutans]MDA0161607.1 HD domain-containing protein [Solirubrobacter ginsenosidimutans]
METGSHLQRMSGHCALIAERLQLDPDSVRAASRLHDVGMSSFGPAVHQRRPLSGRERDELTQHPSIGHVMLSGSGIALLDVAADIALTHHERYDGRGYPRGLRADAIPLAGRIAAVADTFDALTTARPYRPATSIDRAADTLRAERGRQFDPQVVDAFLEELDAAAAVLCRHPEEAADDTALLQAPLLPLHVAAAILAISPSRLRRWADDGRIESVRTAGGHRRFPSDAVRELAQARGVHATVHPLTPPNTPLPLLARCLRTHGMRITIAAAAAVYRDDAPGWFASPSATPALADFTETLAEACARGEYAPALAAHHDLMGIAAAGGAVLLERHTFLQRFGHFAMRTLVKAGGKPEEVAGMRRLLTALQETGLRDADQRAQAR